MRSVLFAMSLMLLGANPGFATEIAAVFVPAGNIAEAVSVVSGVALPDGRVLFSGGWQAQVYDPASHDWQTPIVFRGDHFMGATTLLPDGRALVVGTAASSEARPAAEILNLDTAQVLPVSGPVVRRYGAALMTRADGKVVIWSGVAAGTSWPPVAAGELFDPATNAVEAISVPVPARWNAAVVALEDGRYLIAGGSTADGFIQPQAIVYDPNTNTSVATGSQAGFSSAQGSVRLRDGRILLCGGYSTAAGSTRPTNRAEIYNAQTGHFTTVAPMRVERAGAAMALLPDGRVLIVGGQDSWNQYLVSAEVFDPATHSFSLVDASPLNARAGAMALPIGGGRLILAGGANAQGPIGESEAFIPDSILRSSFD